MKRITVLICATAALLLLLFTGAANAESAEPELFKAETDAYCAIRGDINADGRVTAADARLLLRTAVHLEIINRDRYNAYMVNTDDKITAADARVALRVAVGLEPRPLHVKSRSLTLAEATCAESGITANQCKYCGDLYGFGVLPQKEHTGMGWETVKKPTCTEKGKREQRCVYCGIVIAAELIKETPHIFGEWQFVDPAPDCTKTQFVYCECVNCGKRKESMRPAGAHTFDEWITEAEPTCTAQGKRRLVCSVCKQQDPDTRPEILPAYGHARSEWIVVIEPTYKAEGLRRVICTRCSQILAEEVLPPKQH